MEINQLYHQIIEHFGELKYALLEAQTFDPKHFGFSPLYYKIMETDQVRINAFKDAFVYYDNLQDAVVCEAGVGGMALTKLFLPYVKKAYLIENNPNLIPFIRAELKANGWDKKTELIVGNAMEVQLPESVDFIIGELMSIFCANEFQVQIFKHLRQFLKPTGRLIPEKILNILQLGYAKFEEGHLHYPLLLTRHLPILLTSQQLVNEIDLYKTTRLHVRRKVTVKPILSGVANCVLLHSWVKLVEGINFTGTDSLMPPTVRKLEKIVNLTKGKKVQLGVDFGYGTSLDKARFEVVV